MKIAQVKVNVVRLPHEEPLVGEPVAGSMMRDYLTLQIVTDDGLEGIGMTGFAGRLMRSLRAAVEDLGALTVGDDPLRSEAIMAKLRTAAAPCSPGGIATLALAAFDIALWDIRGKALGVPVARLLGGLRERVPAYASGALMRTSALKDVERAAAALVDKGFRQMKTQMAVEGLTPAQEIERIRVIRGVVGADVALMVDINQRWNVHEAISIGARIEDLGLTWLEDPTLGDRPSGSCRDRVGARHPDLRRRISVRHRAPSSVARAPLGRYRHDRRAARRRHHRLDEDRRDGGGVQPAGGQPSAAGDPGPHDRGGAERDDGRVHAVDAAAVRGPADAGEGRDDGAECAGTRPEIRTGSVREVWRFVGWGKRSVPTADVRVGTALRALPTLRQHYGMTAVASISSRAAGSTSRRTSTSAMAGKFVPITSR